MTSVLEGPVVPDVIEASEDDAILAVQNALTGAGISADELMAEAAAGRFSSLRSRMAWVAIGDMLSEGH